MGIVSFYLRCNFLCEPEHACRGFGADKLEAAAGKYHFLPALYAFQLIDLFEGINRNEVHASHYLACEPGQCLYF